MNAPRYLAPLTLALTLAACTGDLGEEGDEVVTPDEPGGEEQVGDASSALNQFINGIAHFELPDATPKTEISCEDFCPDSGQEGDLVCAYQAFTETAHYDQFVAFQPNSATLWPGAVVRGDDARHGLLTPVGAELAPVVFSVSLENLGGSPIGHMDKPSLSSFREERNEMLSAGVHGATPASLQFEMEEIHDSSQLTVALGAGLDWPGSGEIAANFDFSSTKRTTKLVVKFTQAYYTMDVDTKATPADFFVDGTTPEDLAPYVSEDSPPLYVQSITYGRRVIFTVETEDSADVIRSALEASYSGVVDASLSVDVEHQEALSKSTINAFVIGGSGSSATGVINGYDGLVHYITDGSEYSADSPGAPIAYKLAYLDNAVTKLAFTTDYAEKECFQNQGTVNLTFDGLTHVSGGDSGSEVEIYGYVGIRYPEPGNPVIDCATGGAVTTVWNLNDDSWVDVPKYGVWTPQNPPTLPIHDVAFGEDEQICLFAELWEHDGFLNGDDEFGNGSLLLRWSDVWSGSQTLPLYGGGNAQMDVHTSIDLE